MGIPSDADIWRQLERRGSRWGVVPMRSIYGDVLAAEKIPTRIPLAGFSAVVHVKSDICRVHAGFSFARLLAARKKRAERTVHRRQELRIIARQESRRRKLADIKHEMRVEKNLMQRGRMIFAPR